MLFIVVIVLCVILTRFYFDVTKNTESSVQNNRVQEIVRKFGERQVFESENGNYGVLDKDGTVLIEPDWLNILTITENLILVSDYINAEELIGGIDEEENVILPFVFNSMKKLEDGYWLGTVAEDGRKILYNRNFQPVFPEAFDEIQYQAHHLTLKNQTECFDYEYTENPPIFRRAELSCNISGNIWLNWKIANQVYLSELSKEDLRQINKIVSAYLQMLKTNDFQNLENMTSEEYYPALIQQSLPEGNYKRTEHFSFSRRESGAYDFAFCLNGKPEKLNIHLYFRRNAEKHMILTAADIRSNAEE